MILSTTVRMPNGSSASNLLEEQKPFESFVGLKVQATMQIGIEFSDPADMSKAEAQLRRIIEMFNSPEAEIIEGS